MSAQGELVPGDGTNVIILTSSTYKIGNDGSSSSFNSTINGNGTTLASLVITAGVTDHAVITLKNVTTAKLDIEADAEIILNLQGGSETNDLGEITNNGDLFIKGDKFKFEENVTAINNSLFTDSTASLRVVEGAGALTMGILEANNEEGHLKGIAVATNVSEVTFIWQRRVQALYWMDVDTVLVPGSKIFTCDYYPERAGEYRFRAMVERENSMTCLIHQNTAEVEIYHNVILPEVEGATTEPKAGTHKVLDGEKFDFWLNIDPDYDQSTPVVTTSTGETLTLNNNGNYSIKSVNGATTIHIDGIKPNNPTSTIEANKGLQVSASTGQIDISIDQPEEIKIYSVIGVLKKNIQVSAGSTSVLMPRGIYILQAGKKVVKIMVP